MPCSYHNLGLGDTSPTSESVTPARWSETGCRAPSVRRSSLTTYSHPSSTNYYILGAQKYMAPAAPHRSSEAARWVSRLQVRRRRPCESAWISAHLAVLGCGDFTLQPPQEVRCSEALELASLSAYNCQLKPKRMQRCSASCVRPTAQCSCLSKQGRHEVVFEFHSKPRGISFGASGPLTQDTQRVGQGGIGNNMTQIWRQPNQDLETGRCQAGQISQDPDAEAQALGNLLREVSECGVGRQQKAATNN